MQTTDAAYRPNVLLHALLFALTFASIAWTSAAFAYDPVLIARIAASNSFVEAQLNQMAMGLPYAVLLVLFFLAHEFGHYFAARAHGVVATLPYFIPMPLLGFGTLGAFMRMRSPIGSRRVLFDIGVAGPIAGFVVALAYLIIGTIIFPGVEAIYVIHPEFATMPNLPDWGIHFGRFGLYSIVTAVFTPAGSIAPPTNELYHFPFLAVGWIGMLVTSLNLLPFGQLDGGHITYAMFGARQKTLAKWASLAMLMAGLGFIGSMLLDATRSANPDAVYTFLRGIFGPPLEWIDRNASWWFTGSPMWLVWSIIVRLVVGATHPQIPDETPLDRRRMIIGWIALAILALTFSYSAIYEVPRV